MMLELSNFQVKFGGEELVRGVDLNLGKGEVHGLMGPNGAGKSSLIKAIMGYSGYEVGEDSKLLFEGEDWLNKEMDERARRGMFLGFQSPVSLPGITVFRFLRESYGRVRQDWMDIVTFRKKVMILLQEVGLGKEFLEREVNEGFSGGEKKKMEVVQARLLEPKLVMLDEVDSGVDIDSLQRIFKVIRKMTKDGAGVLLVSHSLEFMEYLKLDRVYVMQDKQIGWRGGEELLEQIKQKGYGGL